jgi:hypothetical protein
MLLLLLGIIGLAATLLEFEEGQVTFPIQQLQNKHKHHPFHGGHRAHMVRHKCNSALDQVRVEWGRKLHPGNVPVLCLLSRDDISQEVGPGKEPMTTEDVEDIKNREVDVPRRML